MKDDKLRKICCLGAGYVGGPTMAVIADKCPDIEVKVLDINEDRIKDWNNNNLDKLPVFEPGLKEIILRVRNRNLFFSTNISNAIEEADMIFISVNTPTKLQGFGAGYASDLKWVEASARQVAKYSKGHTIVVEKSTLPVKTGEVIQKILLNSSPNYDINGLQKTFSVLSNPEFLAEGTAIKDLNYPDRVLIGGSDEKSVICLKSIYENWIPSEKIITTNIWSSELSKLAANAFLAQRISSINSIAAICEATGAKVDEVSNAIGRDTRIGPKFLSAGPGFGGSCFKKDILNLVYLAKYFGLNEVADYWEQVINLNDWQTKRISKLIVQKLFGTVTAKKIALFGFAFKANTNDIRESSAIYIVRDLIENGAKVVIHDPKVTSAQIKRELKLNQNENNHNNELGDWQFEKDPYIASENADAILILTEWKEYQVLDWKKLSTLMRKPSWLFDARGITKKDEILSSNIHYWCVGDGSFS
tara:strand:+ start:7312 stop:8736 length:1425 start_codon:yes stop_codon:yes gene_type:complete